MFVSTLNDGDVFAFTTEVNKRFKHGVPKLVRGIGGPRFSIIAWGRRRSLNVNNGGAEGGTLRRDDEETGRWGGGGGGVHKAAAAVAPSAYPAAPEKVNELVMGSGEVSELIKSFLKEEESRADQQLHQQMQRQQRQQGGGGGGGGGRGGGGGAGGVGGTYGKSATPTAAALAAAAAAASPPPATPGRLTAGATAGAALGTSAGLSSRENRGSAPTAAALRTSLGESAYETLRSSARRYQRGETTADAFYDEAMEACGGCWAPLVELACHLPCVAKRSELLACHARRECL